MTPTETRVMEMVLSALKSGMDFTSERFDQLMAQEAPAPLTGDPVPQCPRRVDGPFHANDGDDVWVERDGRRGCSYCGSMHPDDVFAAIAEGVELGPTDKNYKVYVGGNGKFYFQHFDEAQCRRFIDLLNAKQLNLGGGHFYVRPFFIAPPEAKA